MFRLVSSGEVPSGGSASNRAKFLMMPREKFSFEIREQMIRH